MYACKCVLMCSWICICTCKYATHVLYIRTRLRVTCILIWLLVSWYLVSCILHLVYVCIYNSLRLSAIIIYV